MFNPLKEKERTIERAVELENELAEIARNDYPFKEQQKIMKELERIETKIKVLDEQIEEKGL